MLSQQEFEHLERFLAEIETVVQLIKKNKKLEARFDIDKCKTQEDKKSLEFTGKLMNLIDHSMLSLLKRGFPFYDLKSSPVEIIPTNRQNECIPTIQLFLDSLIQAKIKWPANSTEITENRVALDQLITDIRKRMLTPDKKIDNLRRRYEDNQQTIKQFVQGIHKKYIKAMFIVQSFSYSDHLASYESHVENDPGLLAGVHSESQVIKPLLENIFKSRVINDRDLLIKFIKKNKQFNIKNTSVDYIWRIYYRPSIGFYINFLICIGTLYEGVTLKPSDFYSTELAKYWQGLNDNIEQQREVKNIKHFSEEKFPYEPIEKEISLLREPVTVRASKTKKHLFNIANHFLLAPDFFIHSLKTKKSKLLSTSGALK